MTDVVFFGITSDSAMCWPCALYKFSYYFSYPQVTRKFIIDKNPHWSYYFSVLDYNFCICL